MYTMCSAIQLLCLRNLVLLYANVQIETAKGAETFLDFLMVAEQTFDDAAAAPAVYVYKDDDDI